MENNLYKILQVSDIFVNKYGYSQIVLEQYKQYISNETWLYSLENNNYSVIRITTNTSNQFTYDQNRFDDYIRYFKTALNLNSINALDIHISNNKYEKEDENYDFINIEENYYDGIDLKNIYPEIYNCIHHVDDVDKEINSIVTKMKKTIESRFKNQKISSKSYIAVYIIIGVCVLNYIIGLFLKLKYEDTSAVMVVLGADYKIFTLFLNQYYRLITCSFVHGNFIHLLCNMYCLFSVGRYIEYRYGHVKFLIILFFSILCGSLTQGIISDNLICVGISGGLYGLLVVFIIDMLQGNLMNIKSLMPTIIVNIGLNFMYTTAWQVHLGGAIGGFAIYYCLKDEKIELPRVILCTVLLLCLIYKYVTINTINNIYGGTDFNVLKIYYDLGLKNYSEKLLIKLNDVYYKLGGH